MSWWTFRFTLTHNAELSIFWDISLYEKLSTPQNLQYLKPSLGEIPWEDCRLLSTIRYEWWNRATGFTVPGSLFDPLLSDLLLVSHELPDDAAEATNDFAFFTFLLLNKEHSVNNECWRSIQSVCHSKRPHHMWPRQKDLAVLYSIGPCLKVWYCHRPALFWNHGVWIYIYIYASSLCLKSCPTTGASLFQIVSLLFLEIVYYDVPCWSACPSHMKAFLAPHLTAWPHH